MSKKAVTGYRAKCASGHTTFVAKDEAHAAWNQLAGQFYSFIQCRECSRWSPAQSVMSAKGTRSCGSWCTEGTGTSCTCQCEGRNHGAAYPAGTLWYAR